MLFVRKSINGNMYGSLAPKRTLFARFWMTLAMSNSPRRISLEGGVATSPSTSGATIAGQKKRRKMKAPTAVYLASGNLSTTASEIYASSAKSLAMRVQQRRHTMLQILRNDAGILDEEAQIFSMNTRATI